MRTFVINMDRSKERLQFIQGRLDALGLNHKRIRATDGQQLTRHELSDFKSRRPRDLKRTWRAGQVGCFMSHADAWAAVAAGPDEYALILEDDLHISGDLACLLSSTDWIPEDADVVRLETTGQWLDLGNPVSRIQNRDVRQVISAAWGAGAYILRKSTAAELERVDTVLHAPVDDFLFNKPASTVAAKLVIYQVVPALCIQDKFQRRDEKVVGFGSQIEHGRINQRLHPLRELCRTLTSTLRGKTQISFR